MLKTKDKNYLKHGTFPEGKGEATKIKQTTSQYLIEATTYTKEGSLAPPKVFDKEPGQLRHKRDPHRHLPLLLKQADHGGTHKCRLYVHNYRECQAHCPIDHSPTKELQHITTP
ncbi:hypothetical protein CR513_06622, partial [Mucuna pruriens]